MKPEKAPADIVRPCEGFLTHLKASLMIPDAPNVRVDASDTWTSVAEPGETEGGDIQPCAPAPPGHEVLLCCVVQRAEATDAIA